MSRRLARASAAEIDAWWRARHGDALGGGRRAAPERRVVGSTTNGLKILDDGSLKDPGTPELQRRKRACVVTRLARMGRISKAEAKAAAEIADAVEAVERSDCPSKWNLVRVDTSGGPVRDPLSALSGEALALRARFLAWRGRLTARPVEVRMPDAAAPRALDGRVLVGLTLAVACRNAGLAEAERAVGLARDHGYGLAVFRAALARW